MKKFWALFIFSIIMLIQTSFGATLTIKEKNITVSYDKTPGKTVILTINSAEVIGWQINKGDITIDNNQFIMPDREVEIEAIYSNSAILTVEDDVVLSTALEIPGTEITVSATSDQFSHWTYTGIELSAEQRISKTITFIMPSNNVRLTANYLISTSYTISYDANGGTGAPESQEKTHGETLTLSTQTPTKDAYCFRGWSTNESATSVEYNAGAEYTANGDVTLYAVWGTIEHLPMGVYIEYVPTANTASISNEYTGYNNGEGEQSFTIGKTDETKMHWKVYKNNNGQLDIISAESVGTLHLGNAEGYANAVYTLNTLCSQYVNEYADSAVSIGSTKTWTIGPVGKADIEANRNNSIGRIDITEATGYPLTNEATAELTDKYPYHDTYQTLMPLDANDSYKLVESLRHSAGQVWAATRFLIVDGTTSNFMLRILNAGGSFSYDDLCGDENGVVYVDDDTSAGVRPVVSLKDGIIITGGIGTIDDPYTIGYDPSVYRVSYDANGGHGAPATQVKTPGINLTLSSIEPTREDYNFLGWSTNISATSAEYAAGETYTADANVTLYAVWEEPALALYSVAEIGDQVNYPVTYTNTGYIEYDGTDWPDAEPSGTGWKVLSKDTTAGTVTLVSDGTPLNFWKTSDDTYSSVQTKLTTPSQFINISFSGVLDSYEDYANCDGKFGFNGFSSYSSLTTAFTNDYTLMSSNVPQVRAMTKADIDSVYKAINGSGSTSNGTSLSAAKYKNLLAIPSKTSGDYAEYALATFNSSNIWWIDSTGKLCNDGAVEYYWMPLRIVVTLKADVKATRSSSSEPWELSL